MFIGTNFGHGSSVAVVDKEGRLRFAVEEERLNGVKDTDAYPANAIELALSLYGRNMIHYEGWNIWKRMLFKGIVHSARYSLKDSYYVRHRLFREIIRTKKFVTECGARQKVVGHHLAHAYSLIPWGMGAGTLILVSDTLGENECVTLFYWNGRVMRRLSTSPFPHSIGCMFHQLAYHVGFYGRQGPGKLMALSGYGDPKWYSQLMRFVDTDSAKLRIHGYPIWKLRGAWVHFAKHVIGNNSQENHDLKEEILACRGKWGRARNLAASMQMLFSNVTTAIIRQGIDIAQSLGLTVNAIGLVGGSALNCQANGKIVRQLNSIGIKVLVPPWPDDSGTAIGAAYKAFADFYNGDLTAFSYIESPFLGPEDSSFVNSIGDTIVLETARQLASGKIVGLCAGRMEFGPRALGGRCILAKASLENRDRLNTMKDRPSFMPFAPVVLESDFSRFFLGQASENMAWTVKAAQNAKHAIPGAIHVTNEARVQLIKEGSQSLLSRIMKMYQRLEGHSVLLLTSLNGKDKPIPFTVYDSYIAAKTLGCDLFLSDSNYHYGHL